MKKALTLIMVVCLLIGFTACSPEPRVVYVENEDENGSYDEGDTPPIQYRDIVQPNSKRRNP